MIKKSGVYSITNTLTGQRYIGQSIDCERRFVLHKYTLDSHHRTNRRLQFSWDKYGEDAFVFEVLERCPKEVATEAEQGWMDHFRALGVTLFNVIPAAANVPRVPQKEYVCAVCAVKFMGYACSRRVVCSMACTYKHNIAVQTGVKRKSKYKNDEERRAASKESQKRFRDKKKALKGGVI